MHLGLENKTALVCGASQGIGYACARALAAEGVHVTLVARNIAPLEQAVEQIIAAGGQASAIQADLSQPESDATIHAALPHADILVTNPGGSPAADILSDNTEWDHGINNIVVRPLSLCNHYLPIMQKNQFGRIINITSAAFISSHPGLAFSGALRAALTHAITTLSRRVAKHGITVNNIAPGPVESQGLQHFLERRAQETGSSVDDVRTQRLSEIPTRRFATADEIGQLCTFLASVHAGSMTGRTLLVDGGTNPYPFL